MIQSFLSSYSARVGLALPMKSLAEGSATARQNNELKQRLANAASETEPLTGALHILMFVFEFACTARRPNVCFCVCAWPGSSFIWTYPIQTCVCVCLCVCVCRCVCLDVSWGGEDGRHSHGKMRARRSNLTSVNEIRH